MGNCGVGFAPARPGGEKSLIELMEGVEDIPGTALYEGIEWGSWETFPDYLDYIAGRKYSLDIGAQIAHGAVRYYVMGERGSANEDATAADVAEMTALVAAAIEAGALGVSSRPIGLATGLSGYHAFQRRPTYMRIAGLPLPERVSEMAKPEIKAAILSEADVAVAEPGSMANIFNLFLRAAPVVYPLADPVDYEPEMSACLGARAAVSGDDILSVMYDFLLEQDGAAMGAIMGGIDVHQSQQVIREMLVHPATVTGLSDAGAHVTLICDASMPTTQLTHWARDRQHGERIPLEFLVHKQTVRNAALYGLSDRGTLAPGLRADINVIDFDNLSVSPPKAFHGLPAGGTRLIQPVSGYLTTMVNGVVTRRHDADTGARPGRLVRSSDPQVVTRKRPNPPQGAGSVKSSAQ